MYRLILPLALMLAACVPAAKGPAYRDPAAQIASMGTFDPMRFSGDWQVIAAFGDEARCGPLRESWQAGPTGYDLRGTVCTPAGLRSFTSRAALTGPGRLMRQTAGGPEDIWVLWADADYRIAVLGTPSGQFGRVMTRVNPLPADLWAGARSVLDFYGYDLAQLVPLRRP